VTPVLGVSSAEAARHGGNQVKKFSDISTAPSGADSPPRFLLIRLP
jgi:hypothetical protein